MNEASGWSRKSLHRPTASRDPNAQVDFQKTSGHHPQSTSRVIERDLIRHRRCQTLLSSKGRYGTPSVGREVRDSHKLGIGISPHHSSALPGKISSAVPVSKDGRLPYDIERPHDLSACNGDANSSGDKPKADSVNASRSDAFHGIGFHNGEHERIRQLCVLLCVARAKFMSVLREVNVAFELVGERHYDDTCLSYPPVRVILDNLKRMPKSSLQARRNQPYANAAASRWELLVLMIHILSIFTVFYE